MKKKIEIYLVRHGEIVNDGKKRYIGQVDVPLNDIGRLQAVKLRDGFKQIPLDKVFCSDLTRAIDTASIICEYQRIVPVAVANLREINMGLWDGREFQDICRSFPGEFEKRGADIVNYIPPGGESYARCASRVLTAWKEILTTAAGSILIVGHAGVNRIIISQALGLAQENIFKISQDYGCVNILLASDLDLRVKMLNGTLI